MDMNLLHEITFYVMYAALAIAIFIAIERAIYFAYVRRSARALMAALGSHVHSAQELPQELTRRASLPLDMASAVLAQKAAQGPRKDLDDVIDTQYLASRAPLARSLWIIETITTAAPLLGLLGTILGIIDTFKALASAGVSDPGQISGGIGTALFATGLGIAIALFCVVFHNFFQDSLERINDQLKMLLIRASTGARVQGEVAHRVASPVQLQTA
ncbi:biopolymer transporter ExbB [Pseudomonas agarici]|uniref:Biopolymer transporter ExbB n=1 Tax=Pseudomonas agarici TaxID=46677 RepID=A0A0X1T4D9_PSEAA|nr:MotA/TolQ/ExbB proton channel family protein [Pseudomonas agarici]AMB86910.1 biopolymer transporter ExbB [Pseudomonas agarici]NWB90535.1 MotA/TolQ/ExbB proton channel family protein [Pseudomonas agarici]NWC10975.1 MotA/TolQ/ExbB proton channel family protein [Pseudomonas agarici]SEL34988.1 outer membrane transport energization protein ExbB [Pseudomonas agarici]